MPERKRERMEKCLGSGINRRLGQRKITICAHTLVVDPELHINFRCAVPIMRAGNVSAHAPWGARDVAGQQDLRIGDTDECLAKKQRIGDQAGESEHATDIKFVSHPRC